MYHQEFSSSFIVLTSFHTCKVNFGRFKCHFRDFLLRLHSQGMFLCLVTREYLTDFYDLVIFASCMSPPKLQCSILRKHTDAERKHHFFRILQNRWGGRTSFQIISINPRAKGVKLIERNNSTWWMSFFVCLSISRSVHFTIFASPGDRVDVRLSRVPGGKEQTVSAVMEKCVTFQNWTSFVLLLLFPAASTTNTTTKLAIYDTSCVRFFRVRAFLHPSHLDSLIFSPRKPRNSDSFDSDVSKSA